MLRAALALLVSARTATAGGGISLTVDSKSGKYSVSVDGTPWFTSTDYEYTSANKVLSTADGSLKLSSSTTGTGSDVSGTFTSTTLSWDSGKFVTEFRACECEILISVLFS